MEHYIIHNPKVNLYSALVDTVAMAVHDGVFKNIGIIQNSSSDSVRWLIRSLEIKDHEHLVEVYNDILFEIQEHIARREGQEFIIDTDNKIIIESATEILRYSYLMLLLPSSTYHHSHSKFRNEI